MPTKNVNAEDRLPSKLTKSQRSDLYGEVIDAIKGLSFITNQMRRLHLNKPAHIVAGARDHLLDWAININFQEIAQDKYLGEAVYGSGLTLAMDLITQRALIEDKMVRTKVLRYLKEIRSTLDSTYKNNNRQEGSGCKAA